MKHAYRLSKIMLILFLSAVFLCPGWLAPHSIFAETGSVIIASDTSVQVGDSMTVTVKYAASSLGLIDGELRYNPDMLKYVSGGTSINQGGGIIKMNKTLTGETSQLFVIKFKVVGAGSDFFLVNTFQLKDKTNNDLGTPGASVKLVAKDPVVEPAPEDPVVIPEEPAVDPSTETPAVTDDPVITDENTATDTKNETAPDTLWVFVGAIAATTVLLVISLVIVNRRK